MRCHGCRNRRTHVTLAASKRIPIGTVLIHKSWERELQQQSTRNRLNPGLRENERKYDNDDLLAGYARDRSLTFQPMPSSRRRAFSGFTLNLTWFRESDKQKLQARTGLRGTGQRSCMQYCSFAGSHSCSQVGGIDQAERVEVQFRSPTSPHPRGIPPGRNRICPAQFVSLL